jgi:hypothetical protein
MRILTPLPMREQGRPVDRALLAAQFRLSAGLGKAVDRLKTSLHANIEPTKAVDVAANVLRDALGDLRPDMTVTEILNVLMTEGR